VAAEQHAPEHQPRGRQANPHAIPTQQAVAERVADHVAAQLAGNCAQAGRQHDQVRVELVRADRKQHGADQQRLAGQRQAQAFQRNQDCQRRIAVGVQEAGQEVMRNN
jgi:hypothetical protein